MIPTSTERQLSRTRVAKYRAGDPALYLRTYDVINSLDRAQSAPRWDKFFTILRRFRQGLQAPALRAIQAAQLRALAAPAAATEMSSAVQLKSLEAPREAVGRAAKTLEREPIAVTAGVVSTGGVRAVSDYTSSLIVQRREEDRSISWVLLAVVAMVTAGVTFAAIHFAWPSLQPESGWPHHKHVSSFVTTRSMVLPQLLLRSRTISKA